MKKNIKVLYDSAKGLVRQAESAVSSGKEIDPTIVSTLESIFKDIIEYEKVYLIQCQDRFYGSILMDMDVTIDFHQRGRTDLKMKKSPIELSINPMFCADYTFSQFTGLIITELMRLVWLHPASYGELNSDNDKNAHKILEKASDAAATTIVQRDVRLGGIDGASYNQGLRLPPDVFTVQDINSTTKVAAASDQPLEYYYAILKRFGKNQNADNTDDIAQGQTGMNLSNGAGNSVATKNNNVGEEVHQWENLDQEETTEQIKSMISNVYNNMSEEARGYMPGSIVNQIKKLMAPPEINWKQVLKKMVGSVPVPHRNTKRKLNRRQPERFDLPGKLPKRIVNVVVAFDTSGSMSDKMLEYCMNEVFNIVKVYEGFKITVIETDYYLQRVYEVKKMSDLKLEMKGRGGTSFVPTIEYINGEGQFKNSTEYPNAGKYKDALLIYFTDGYGDSSIPKPKTYRNLWVVFDRVENLSLAQPYGEVKSLKGDKEFRKAMGI